jgi:hypothetical protein
VDVNYGGVLRLERPDETTTKTIESKPIFDDDADDQQQHHGQLALGRPAKDSAELDRWNAAGEFKPSVVGFVDADGNRTEMIAAPDPLLPKEGDSALVKDLKARAAIKPAHPFPLDKFGNRTLASTKGHTADDDVRRRRAISRAARTGS